MTSSEVIIQMEGVGKVFVTEEMETHALSDIHLSIAKGEFVSMEGPSGSGKTTLLSILGLLDAASSGSYKIAGQSTADFGARERTFLRNQKIGFIFQSFNLIGDLTVFENVELPLTFRDLSAAERRKRVDTALDRVGMKHRARHMPAQLSGGQQQRVAVARAVAGDPLVLLADEPTGNLDSTNGDAVMTLLCELHAAGATICMVTHNPDYAKQASRSIHLFDGRLVDENRVASRPLVAAVDASA